MSEICAYCMLHRHKTFHKVVKNIRDSIDMPDLPVYAFSFRESFDEATKNLLETNISNLTITFIDAYEPTYLTREEFFWSRVGIPYVKNRFPISRRKYMSMCHFVSDPGLIPFISNYKYALQFDDDSWFNENFPISEYIRKDIFSKSFATSHTFSADTPNRVQTRYKFFSVVKQFLKLYNIEPVNKLLKKAVDECSEDLYHSLRWSSCNFNLYRMQDFLTSQWREWITFVKESDGIFKYRWGDQEIIGTYFYIYNQDPFLDWNIYSRGIYTDKINYQNIIHIHESMPSRIFSISKKVCRKTLKFLKLKLF